MTLLGEITAAVDAAVTEPLPADAVQAAKSRLLNALGVALVSQTLAPAACAWVAVGDLGGPCAAVGRGRVSEEAAAFYNGVAGHCSLLEDCGPGGMREGSHPSTYVIPAALAAAESVRADGPSLIRGIVAGYETVGVLGAVSPPEIVARGFRPVAVAGPFGAAGAAASLHGLSTDQTEAALALAANMGGGVSQGFVDGTMEPFFHAGLAARSGVFATRLARSGAHTSPHTLDGPHGFFQTFAGAPAVAGLARPLNGLYVSRVGTKRFPSCLQNQATMALVLEQAPEVEVGDVERIVLHRPARGTNGLNSPGVAEPPPYGSMLQTQMSARFTTAAALLRRPVEQPSYFVDAYTRDEAVGALAARIELVPSEGERITLDLTARTGAPFRLVSSGSDVLFPDAATIRDRFLARAEPVLGARALEVAALVERLETIDDVSQLTDLVIPPRHDGKGD